MSELPLDFVAALAVVVGIGVVGCFDPIAGLWMWVFLVTWWHVAGLVSAYKARRTKR